MITRLLLVATMMVAVGAVIVSSTGAFFSDTETSTGNTFTAGDIDLQIDNESYVTDVNGVLVASPSTSWSMADLQAGVQKFFNFADLKPGDVGEDTISIHVGSNNAWMCAAARITSDLDNDITEPEDEAGGPALSDGTTDGDLDSAVNFVFWRDDGDNVLEGDEAATVFLQGPLSALGAQGSIRLADSSGSILGGGPIPGNSTFYIGKAWCFGTLTQSAVAQDGLGKQGTPQNNALVVGVANGPLNRGTGVSCNGASVGNISQTDSVVGDMQFYAVQARNNPTFTCAQNYIPTWVETAPIVEVNQADLATILSEVVNTPTKWFFYNDTNDTVMTIDQFAGTSGQNHMELVAGEEGAKMVLDTGVNPRYNIATAQFGDLLNTISSLKFRVYDATADGDTPFLQFNVDFPIVAPGYEGRLTMQPGSGGNAALAPATWTTVDAQGTAMWTWSKFAVGPDLVAGGGDDNTWPDGNTNQYRSWNDIVA
ncbi:MAG: hypothetical protein RLZZ283_541, partial [Candidatus Parcubacteria bacterium]